MNDNELNMLTAFLVALSQQKKSLPDEVLTKLRPLSVNLRVDKLDEIASSYEPLLTPYEKAFDDLTNQSHQRKQGIDVIPDDSQAKKATNTTFVDNVSRRNKDLPDMEKTLEKLNEIAPNKDKLSEIFSSVIADDNPVVAMQNYFTV
jgi:hypothetical protein